MAQKDSQGETIVLGLALRLEKCLINTKPCWNSFGCQVIPKTEALPDPVRAGEPEIEDLFTQTTPFA